MLVFIYYLLLLIELTHGQPRDFNFFMPDLPSSSFRSILSSSAPTTLKIHPFTSNSFTKIHLSGGPFNIKLYQNLNSNDNYTSVDVEAEESKHKLILIDIVQNDILSIRMNGNSNSVNKTNITITITYFQLNELSVDGKINIQCLNQIQTDKLRLHNRANGFIKLKLNLNILDAYLHSVGRIKLCGEVKQEATIQSLGVGDVNCQNLYTKKINVISSGIGNIYVTATDEIYITLSGIGTVYYTGPIKQQIKTGLGNIIQMENDK